MGGDARAARDRGTAGAHAIAHEAPDAAGFSDRRVRFGSVAERYDTARPGYPQAVIDALVRFAGIDAGGRVLEIGAGTGQATAQLAGIGLQVLALEPSAEMVEILRRRFSPPLASGSVEVTQSELESAALAPEAFDLVFAASTWHWLAERTRWERALYALRHGGTVAAVWHWPLWRRTALRDELDAVYAASGAPLARMGAMIEYEPALEPLRADWLADAPDPGSLLDACGVEQEWAETYTTARYVALINTYADHIELSAPVRARLDAGIADVIDRAGGTIVLPYRTFLLMAHRR